jgi:hypothetical protein
MKIETFPFRLFLERSQPKQRVDKFFETMEGLKFTDSTYLAGGAVRNMIEGADVQNDWDLFFTNEVDCHKYLDTLVDDGADTIRENDHCVTLLYNQEMIQAIHLQYFNSMDEVLTSFDFTICQFGYEPATKLLHCAPFSLWDLARKRLVPTKITYPVSSFRRMLKYVNQGFYMCSGGIHDMLQQSRHVDLENAPWYVD